MDINQRMVASIDALATRYANDAIRGMHGSTLTDVVNVARVARDISKILPYQTQLHDIGTGSASFVQTNSYIVNNVANIANFQWQALFDALHGNLDARVRPTTVLDVFTQLINLSSINEYLTFIGTHPHVFKLVGFVTFLSAYRILSERGVFNYFLGGMKQMLDNNTHRVTLIAKQVTFVFGTPFFITSIPAIWDLKGELRLQLTGFLVEIAKKALAIKVGTDVFTKSKSSQEKVFKVFIGIGTFIFTGVKSNSMIHWITELYNKRLKP